MGSSCFYSQCEELLYQVEIKRFGLQQLSNALCTFMHYSRQVNLLRSKDIVSNLKATDVIFVCVFCLHSPAGLIVSDSRKRSIKNVVLLLIFSQISCGQLHSGVFSEELCLVAHTLFIEEKSVLSPSSEALWGRQMVVEWPCSSCSPVGGDFKSILVRSLGAQYTVCISGSVGCFCVSN